MQKGVKDTINFPKSASKKVIAFSVFLLMSSLLLTQSIGQYANAVASDEPQLVWSKTYGSFQGNSFTQTVDGGYLIFGVNSTYSFAGRGFQGQYPLLLETNSNGVIQSAKTYSQSSENEYPIMQTSDSGYLYKGWGEKTWFTKTTVDGTVQWNKTIPVDSIGNLIQTSDGGYFSADFCRENTSAIPIGIIYKLDSTGNLLWNKTLIPGKYVGNVICDSIETSDGDYIIVGAWNSECWFGKFDNEGNLLVNKTYSFYDSFKMGLYFESISKTSDNNYIISGRGLDIGCLFKVDVNGEELWYQSYSLGNAYTNFCSAVETKDGGYVAVGSFNSTALVLKTDAVGTVQWTSTYGEGNRDSARSVMATEDGFVVTGQLNYNVWLAKFSLPVTVTPTPSTSIANNLTYFMVVVLIFIIGLVGIAIWQLKTKKPI